MKNSTPTTQNPVINSKAKKMTNKYVDITDYLSGTLSTDDKYIYADLVLKVTSSEFTFGGLTHIIQTNYKGLAFNYYHNGDNSLPDIQDNALLDIEIKFTIEKPDDWIVGDQVRVMQINEACATTFNNLKPYFEQRLDEFGYSLKTEIDHMKFNCVWNHKNPKNPVYDIITIRIPPLIESTNIPRLTKRDGIFTLVRR